ncbi:hypothetical protein [Massilia alkalitolerans]|jgi:hypothetical protein|uniref:hypothetical protein n=1 Tax=Massilia alkalitolerans TaxID=286638 RepID=UPI000488D660|nr:hypothetical protein [Massilia alkalitolerans]
MERIFHDKEASMSMQSEGKDAKGRNYDQVTRDGSSSAGSMGTGGTGDIGQMGGPGAGPVPKHGSQQSASRSDDLLAGDTTHQEADQAFSGGSQGGQIQTGMEGIGKGSGASRQSGQEGSQQSGQQAGQQGNMPSGQTDSDQYDQGTAPRER